MKRLFAVTAAAALAGLFAVSLATSAAPPPNAGGGGSSGGGGGGGGTPGGGGKTPPEYGDLWILYRDSNGVPYVTPTNGAEGMCVQPLPSADCPVDCQTDGWADGVLTTVQVVDLDQALCGVPAECAICTQEVEFERDNVIRAKESVLTSQLEDATIKLATAGCLSLDPAGRPVASSVVDGSVVSSAIDSPIQSLGIYGKYMQDGYLGLAEGDIDLYAVDWLDTAARAMGGSFAKENVSDKLDMVVYMNEILGLTQGPEASLLCNPCLTQQVREEYQGAMRTVTKSFLDYSGYAYNRYANFANLPYEAYIHAQEFEGQYPALGDVMEGYFEYDFAVGDGTSVYTTGPISETVFDANSESLNLVGFAQAADDARAVINFMHSNPLHEEYVTPIPCTNATPEHFDIFISPRSGLKVPIKMAAAGDGREGSVTVENGGPATATGVSVVVTGEYWVGGDQKFVQLLDGMGGEAIFTSPMPVDPIEPGYSATIPFFFVMMESADITWTARAYPDDVNAANNVVTKTTIVKKPKGGGGGGGDH